MRLLRHTSSQDLIKCKSGIPKPNALISCLWDIGVNGINLTLSIQRFGYIFHNWTQISCIWSFKHKFMLRYKEPIYLWIQLCVKYRFEKFSCIGYYRDWSVIWYIWSPPLYTGHALVSFPESGKVSDLKIKLRTSQRRQHKAGYLVISKFQFVTKFSSTIWLR